MFMSCLPDLTSNPDAQQVVQQLARLVEVSVTLNSTLDPDQLLRFIIRTAAELLECETASILLYNEKRGELNFISASSESEKLAEIPVPLEGSIAGAIFRENKPYLNNNVDTDPRHFTQVGEKIQFHPRSLVGVPMCIREKTTGVLEAVNKRRGEFTETDMQILAVIASQAAVAIHNARLVQALQNAYNELSRIDKIKSDFMAIASHELRTPLGVILGYASFLKDEAQGELSSHASMVLNSALKMRSLVEAMTNMNLLQMGSLDMQMQAVSMPRIFKAVYEEIAPSLEAKQQKLSFAVPEKVIQVKGDFEKLKRIFINLLDNAVRFTPEGGEITVSLRSHNHEAWVTIKDNGIGIPPSELKDIFREFYQVEDHMTRRYGGLGLGLAIAKGLVAVHKGRIWAESEGSGKGATFKVVLPEHEG